MVADKSMQTQNQLGLKKIPEAQYKQQKTDQQLYEGHTPPSRGIEWAKRFVKSIKIRRWSQSIANLPPLYIMTPSYEAFRALPRTF
jgi:hypothetical protein